MMKTKQFITVSLLLTIFTNFAFAQGFYTNGERITGVLDEKWGAASAWENNIRYAVTYSTPTNILLIQENWNGFSWDIVRKSNITLNANYSINTSIEQKWDGAQAEWRNSRRSTATYLNNDPNKFLVSKSDTANALNNALWDDYERQTHTYNPNGLELQRLSERKNGSTWQATYRDIYTYNANSLKTSSAWQEWETVGYWKSLIKSLYYYNANSLVSLKVDSIYIPATPRLNTLYQKTQYLYNPANLLAQELQTDYDRTANVWQTYIFSKRLNSYNAQNLLTQARYETYDINTSAYITRSMNTFTYNAQNLQTQSDFETYDYNLGILTPYSTSTKNYNTANNPLVSTYFSHSTPTHSYRSTFTYGSVVGTEQTAGLTFQVSLFPNPTTEQINIALPDNNGVTVAMIMATNGQVIKTQNLTDTQSTINVKDLAAGSYQILLLNAGKSAAKTFIKQ